VTSKREQLCGGERCGWEAQSLSKQDYCEAGSVVAGDTDVGGALVSRDCYSLGVECFTCTDHRYTFLLL
jgi:hypothetical protein